MEKRKKNKKWPYVLAIIALALVGVVVLVNQVKKASDELFQYSHYTVARGNVVSSVTGTGVIAFSETEVMELPSGITLDKVLAQAGDSVKAGEAMATLDFASLETRQKELLKEISTLDMQLGSLQRSSAQTKLTSLVGGRVAQVYAIEGGDVAKTLRENGALMLLSTDGKLKAEFTAAAALTLGAKVDVELSDGDTIEGTVEKILGQNVIVTVDDADADFSEAVRVYLDAVLVGEAELTPNAPLAVVAESGVVDDIKVKAGDKVRMGTVLLTLTEAPYAKEYYDAFEARHTAAETLDAVRAYLYDPNVYAPADCVVRAAYFKDGDTVSAAMGAASASTASSDVTLFEVGLTSSLEVLFDADELDVPLLKVGQEATVTVNALSGETFPASVKSISGTGEAYNGVTTYRVRLSLTPDARLYAGMNCSAVIAIEERDDVLVAPLITLSEDAGGMYAYVTPSGGAKSGDRVRRNVVAGLSDGIGVEIVSGLNEGDVISYEDRDAMMENMMKMFGERFR
ncbi:MAG: efflux RND transporter periplasmic adaptor subunit [Clostridiaceae bacterium]